MIIKTMETHCENCEAGIYYRFHTIMGDRVWSQKEFRDWLLHMGWRNEKDLKIRYNRSTIFYCPICVLKVLATKTTNDKH